MATLTQFDEYVLALANHDWTFDYSDDINVWRKGKAAQTHLAAKANTDSVLRAAFNAYRNYHLPLSTVGYDWQAAIVIRDAVIEALRSDLKVAATTELIAPGNAVA